MAWQEVLLILAMTTPIAVVLLVLFMNSRNSRNALLIRTQEQEQEQEQAMAIAVAHLIIARHIISARINSSSVDPEERKKIVIKSLVISVSENNNRKIESVSTFM